MLWSIDTCQIRWSADQYHVTISRAQVYSSSRSRIFTKVACWPCSGFRLDRGFMSSKIVENIAGLFGSLLTLIQVRSKTSYNCFAYRNFVSCSRFVIIKLKNRRPNNIQKTSNAKLQSWNRNSTLSWVSLLGWPKSIYYENSIETRCMFSIP